MANPSKNQEANGTRLHNYEIRPRKNKRGVDLISDALPFGRLWYGGANAAANAIGYAEHFTRSHDAVIRVYPIQRAPSYDASTSFMRVTSCEFHTSIAESNVSSSIPSRFCNFRISVT